jgi:cyclopropane fatty-acyl-phospholipid synthase-like methyltransferase
MTVSKLGFKQRLAAWWEGEELPPEQREAAPAEAAPMPVAAAEPPPAEEPPPAQSLDRFGRPLWNATRIEVAETMWGEGFLTPGGAGYAPLLVKPLALSKEMSLLDLTAGLGGLARAVVAETGCWVTGLEVSEPVAKLGMDRSQRAGQEKQAAIKAYNPSNLKLGRRFDAVFAKESLFTVADKDALFDTIEEHLKPKGQILYTDYVIEDEASRAGLKAWMQAEPQDVHLWSVAQHIEGFKQRNLDVRVTEDITPKYIAFIVDGVGRLRDRMSGHGLSTETKAAIMAEVQLWARRMDALQHKGLRVYRFLALKLFE